MAQYVNGILWSRAPWRCGSIAAERPGGGGPDLADGARLGGGGAAFCTILSRGGHRLDVVTQHSYQESGREVLRRMGGHGLALAVAKDPTVREIMARRPGGGYAAVADGDGVEHGGRLGGPAGVLC